MSNLSNIKDPRRKNDNRLDYNQVLSLLGYKFYKIIDDKIETIRIVNVKNKDIVSIVIGEDYNNRITKDPNDIVENYSKLKSDGIITFNIVTMGESTEGKLINDVIVCLHKADSIDKRIQEPDVVCRQNISDLYYNFQRTNNTEMVGMCMTKDTCPANLDYRVMTACSGVEYSIGINIYIEDNIDNILTMIPTKKINNVLEVCLKEHLKSMNKIDTGKVQSYNGYCRTINQLLKENNFQYDFDSVFNIVGLDVDMQDNLDIVVDEAGEEYTALKENIINQLNNIFMINITNTICIQYDHDIDLSELNNVKYILLRDNNNNIFIVNYTENGEYRQSDLEVIKAKEALDKTPYLFNRDKYNY